MLVKFYPTTINSGAESLRVATSRADDAAALDGGFDLLFVFSPEETRMRRPTLTAASVSAVVFSGCDPVVNVAGANFPAWLVCVLAGAFGAALLRPVFVAARLEAYLWPLPAVYVSLAALIACVVYLVCFHRI